MQFDFDVIREDVEGDEAESQILDAFGREFYEKIKSVIITGTTKGTEIDEIKKRMLGHFKEKYDEKKANLIVQHFADIVEEQFDDVSNMKEDVEDLEESEIINHVLQQMDANDVDAEYIGQCIKRTIEGTTEKEEEE